MTSWVLASSIFTNHFRRWQTCYKPSGEASCWFWCSCRVISVTASWFDATHNVQRCRSETYRATWSRLRQRYSHDHWTRWILLFELDTLFLFFVLATVFQIMSKTPQLKTARKNDRGYIENSKNQKGDITLQHIAVESMCWQVISPFWCF